LEFNFRGELFQTVETANGAWVFAALPTDRADEILELETRRSGFGSVRVAVHLGTSEWQTSIFPSKEHGTYLLPVKKSIRA
jgi:hypothetical protein